MNNVKRIDLGCGPSKMPGALGVDVYPWAGVDVVANLDQVPWPLPDNSFDEIYFNSSLEHLTDIKAVFDEAHRIARNGAVIVIHAPHFSSADTYTDLTHKHGFSIFSFDPFLSDHAHPGDPAPTFRLISRRFECWILSNRIRLKPYWIIEKLANIAPHFYERFLAFIFPARSIHVFLEVVKLQR